MYEIVIELDKENERQYIWNVTESGEEINKYTFLLNKSLENKGL